MKGVIVVEGIGGVLEDLDEDMVRKTLPWRDDAAGLGRR